MGLGAPPDPRRPDGLRAHRAHDHQLVDNRRRSGDARIRGVSSGATFFIVDDDDHHGGARCISRGLLRNPGAAVSLTSLPIAKGQSARESRRLGSVEARARARPCV